MFRCTPAGWKVEDPKHITALENEHRTFKGSVTLIERPFTSQSCWQPRRISLGSVASEVAPQNSSVRLP